MKLRIRFDEVHIARVVVDHELHPGEFLQPLHGGRVPVALCGELRGGPFDRGPKVIDVVHALNRDLRDKVSSIGDDLHQVFPLQEKAKTIASLCLINESSLMDSIS